MNIRLALAPIALIAAILPQAAAAKLYGVIVEVKADDAGAITSFTVAQVLDPMSGNTTPVSGIVVSDDFLKAARAAYSAKHPKSKGGFTYFFMDTDKPDVLAASPK